ncbi:hypothetical protein TWF730_003918 [Orbilia blumenaviensis]|uniref:Kelch repeat-containing protein n=1 Tax=Orbilia blumenaviensis TaxID=1796055 RepID=A0AAV9U141_9PEZI
MSTLNVTALDPAEDSCSFFNHAAIIFRDQFYIAQGNAAYKVGSAASSDTITISEGNNPWLRYFSLNESFTVADLGARVSTVASYNNQYNDIPQRKNPIFWNIVRKEYSNNGTRGIMLLTLGHPVLNITAAGRGNEIRFSLASNKTSGPEFGDFDGPSGAFDISSPYSSEESRFFSSRNNYFDEDENVGYIVGGLVDEDPTGTFLSFGSGDWRNSTLPWGVTAGDGAMGALKLNNRTILVYTGGEVDRVNSQFDIARIWDSRSGIWYDQPLTGFQNRIPSPRRGSCTAMVAAPDGSSYQMLMYGGISDDDELPLSELWALNIPSFTWVLLDNSAGGSTARHIPGRRFGSTCHLIKGNKLMIFGGSKLKTVGERSFVSPTDCDINQSAGFFMDLNTVTWLEDYNPEVMDYEVPERIRAVIGGGPTGGATMGQPLDGFADPTLTEILRVPINTSPPDPTSTGPTGSSIPPSESGDSGLPTGAIVGIAIAAVLIAIGGLFFLYRWTRNRKRQITEGDDPNGFIGKAELPAAVPEPSKEAKQDPYKDHQGQTGPPQELGADAISRSELPGGYATAQNVMELPTGDWTHPVELPADVPHAELADRDSRLPPPPDLPKAPQT